MLRRLLTLAALLGCSAFASATTSTGTFNVGITLNSNCVVNTSATTIAFTYTSFGAAATSNSSFTLQCTNNLAITSVALDGTPAAGVYTYTDQATGLIYTLQLGAVPTSNGAANAITVSGNMGASQTGTCAGTTCTNTSSTNKTRTITVTF